MKAANKSIYVTFEAGAGVEIEGVAFIVKRVDGDVMTLKAANPVFVGSYNQAWNGGGQLIYKTRKVMLNTDGTVEAA